MKSKTQIRIGLFVAIGMELLYAPLFVKILTAKPFSSFTIAKSLPTFFLILILAVYILGIVRKKLKAVRIAYRAWWIYGIIFLAGLFLGGLLIERQIGFIILWLVVPFGLFYGFVTFILWVGFRGLKQIIESEKPEQIVER
jgi:hypothetical protein